MADRWITSKTQLRSTCSGHTPHESQAAHKGWSSWGKLTVSSLVTYTPPNFLMASNLSSRLNLSNFSSTTRASTLTGHLLFMLSWTSPTPEHQRVLSPIVIMSTSFLFQEWQSDLLMSDWKQSVSCKYRHLIQLMCMAIVSSALFSGQLWDIRPTRLTLPHGVSHLLFYIIWIAQTAYYVMASLHYQPILLEGGKCLIDRWG